MDTSKRERIERLQAMIAAVPSEGLPQDFEGKRDDQRDSRQNAVDSASNHVKRPKDGGPSDAHAAYRRLVDLCGYHEFCCHSMRERLLREGYPNDSVESAIEDAVNVGLIDDARWGEMRASALMRKGWGNQGITRELQGQGINIGQIDGWPQEYEERHGAEFERALQVLLKSPPRSKNPQASAYAKLVRKGYSPGIASKASKRWIEIRDQGN